MASDNPRDVVRFAELLDHHEQESRRGHQWFSRNPTALDVKADIAGAGDIRGLVHHIVLVELRYAEWLLGDELTPPDQVPTASADALSGSAEAAYAKWHAVLGSTTPARWDEVVPFPKPMEHLKPTRRKCFVHAMMHSVRHWAQAATALRAAGHKPDFDHDFLFSTAIE